MNVQVGNLVVLGASYLIVHIISSYFEKKTDESTGLSIDFIHYMLLGYFSSSLWMLIIVLTVLYELFKYNFVTFIKHGIMKVLTGKFAGLITGMLLHYKFPMRINLLKMLRRATLEL